ncbi:LOW QUALITY PROTEIN: BRCA2-interacting transcriptional repressor EMSY [Pipra filicauda]|uniref:BRCA2-interacting transcriptional repressor EMSY n=1 Tax=Pipra filicauda TaxID=649802 RepID=A0A6J2GE90_9PASS|nr:LOW QUALITY PROTEIN: BRCA2-interacting transcriptional repressor EMSY [Pipra filicauda]
MPVVWPTLLDLSRDECKRILRKLELEAYAGVISALRAQGDLTKEKKDLLGELSKVLSISTERHRAEVRRAVNDERLTTIAHNMSGPNSSSEWSIEGRRLVPLMPRLVPQTAFTVTANAVANAAVQHNSSLPLPADTGSKEVVVCYSYTSTTSTPTSTPVPGGSVAAVKSPRPASPASSVVVLPSGSAVYVKSVSCSDDDEKPRKRRRTNSSSSSPVLLKEVPKAVTPVTKTITVPVSGSPKMSNIMQSIANSLPPHMSPVKITFTKPSTQTTNTTTQKVIIVTTSPSSTFVPNILSKSHNYAAVTKLVPTSVIASTTQKPPVVITAAQPSVGSSSSSCPAAPCTASTIAVTAVVSSTPSVVMSTVAQGVSTSAIKVASTRLPSPKALVGSPSQLLAQFPKQHQQPPKQQLHQVPPAQQQQQQLVPSSGAQQQPQQAQLPPGIKPTIQIKQESGVKIITQQVQPSKILPKPVTATLPSSSNSPIMVVSSNGTIMTTKLGTTPTGTPATYSRPTVSPSLGARMAGTPGAATYVKTTSGSIITVVPKSLATLGGKIISSNIVSGTTTKITTIPMTSKPNVIVVQKTTGKGTTIQGLPGKNVVTTLLNAGGEKTIQAVPAGAKPAIITATRPITKMIVTQPKGIGSTVQPATKIIPTKIVYGQQGKTQVLIKPKPVTFQATVVSEQTRQLVTETLQQASRVAETGAPALPEVKEEPQTYTDSSSSSTESSQSSQDSQPVVHVIASRSQDWSEHEIAVDTSPTIIYQDVSSESQSATSTIKALLELQQTTVKEKLESKPRQPTIDLSQMAVPIQMTQEKRHSPESPSIAVVESELVAEYITTVSHRQPPPPAQPPRTLLQHVAQSQTATQTSVVVKSIPASSTGAITHIMQQALSSHTAFTKHSEQVGTEEGEVEEMDTLDPQTGLFYRSALTQSQAQKQQKLSQPQLEQTQLQVKTLQCFQTKQKQTIHLQADQIQHKLPQMPQLSIRHQKLTPLQQEQAQSKPDAQHPPHHMMAKERQLPTLVAQPQQTVVQVLAVKTTQQLPKLQQAPTAQKIYVQPQPPPSPVQLPASSDKQPASQVQHPTLMQGSTVTELTLGGCRPPVVSEVAGGSGVPQLALPVTSLFPMQAPPEAAVADILRVSVVEAHTDANIEHTVVDPPEQATSTSKVSSEAESSPCPQVPRVAALGTTATTSTPQQQPRTEPSPAPPAAAPAEAQGVPPANQFVHIQNLSQKKAEESSSEIVVQTIPHYSIPCHSSSNVVVEPSGLLELNNFTSQRLDDEETAMEQDGDSGPEDGPEPSPSRSSAEQS